MKTPRPFPFVTITQKGAAALQAGHPWVYEGEVLAAENPRDGGLCDVFDQKRRYLGTGFYNSHSLMRVRVISKNPNDRFDLPFWRRRLQHAIDYRRTVMGGEDFKACRLIFGEADYFPGLTVDRFGPVLVAETMSLGMERMKPVLFPLLVQLLREQGEEISALYQRDEGDLRKKEGLPLYKGFYDLQAAAAALQNADGPFPAFAAEAFPNTETAPTVSGDETPVRILENGIEYQVDFVNGQKTGFFLDQKYNRQAAAKLAAGKRVLDCFTHTGSFGLCCAAAGAASVLSVDVSKEAIALAAQNAARNGLEEKVEYLAADVFDLLPKLKEQRAEFDYIILDPPAFTKSRKTVQAAASGYKEINLRAMQLLPRGGYLATASCSHFIPRPLFEQILADAAKDAGVSLRLIESRGQAPDHPVLWGVPETDYLKFYLFQVV